MIVSAKTVYVIRRELFLQQWLILHSQLVSVSIDLLLMNFSVDRLGRHERLRLVKLNVLATPIYNLIQPQFCDIIF